MLRIYLFGEFRVELDSEFLTESVWPRRKAKSLLKLLAIQPGYRLHKEQVIEWLWPDQDLTSGANNLYRTLHLLRQVLDNSDVKDKKTAKGDNSYILLREDILRLNTEKDVWTDLEAFEKLFDRIQSTSLFSTNLLEEAISLYSGDLLEEDPYEEWLLTRRENCKQRFQQMLLNLAENYRQRRAFAPAISILQRLLAQDKTNEVAYRELLLNYSLNGQRSEAIAEFQICREVLSTELGLDPSPETLELYSQVLRGEIKSMVSVVETPLVMVNNTPLYTIPNTTTPLVGREIEVEQACKILEKPENRLLTLSGPGGVGKTRVALAVVNELLTQKRLTCASCFVNLAPISDQKLLSATIAEALGIKEAGNLPLLQLVKYTLRDQDFLMVLDNFEQLIEAAPLVAELLNACPRLKILVTSRTVLHLYGEHELAISPLNLPSGHLPTPLEVLRTCPAIKLFVQRATAVKADFELTSKNAPIILEICQRLDGLPLAIELAAARLKLLEPETLLNQLKTWLNRASSNSSDKPARHHTMSNTLDWSYQLLTPAEQALFVQLSLFAGSFSLEAMTHICYAETPDPLATFDLVSNLLDKSLLYPDRSGVNQSLESENPGFLRFRMLETIRQYAESHRQNVIQSEDLYKRHLDYFLGRVEQIEVKLHSKGQSIWLKELEADHNNLRVALEYALEKSKDFQFDKGARLTAALGWFWHVRGYWSEGNFWLEKVLSEAEKQSLDAETKAKILYGAALTNLFTGNPARANSLLQESLDIYEALGIPWGIAHSLDLQAEIYRQQGKFDSAQPLYERSLVLFEQIGDFWCANHEVIGLGYVNVNLGNYHQAEEYFQRSLKVCQELEDRAGMARALNGQAELYRKLQDYNSAASSFMESLRLYRELGQTANVCLLLHNLGQLENEYNHLQTAATHFKGSLIIGYEIKNNRFMAWCLIGLALILLAEDHPKQAAQLCGAATALLPALTNSPETLSGRQYKQNVTRLKELLPSQKLTELFSEGTKLRLEEIIMVALNL